MHDRGLQLTPAERGERHRDGGGHRGAHRVEGARLHPGRGDLDRRAHRLGSAPIAGTSEAPDASARAALIARAGPAPDVSA